MTTVAQIKEKLSGDAKKNVTDIIDPKIFASVNGLSGFSQTTLELSAASMAKELIQSSAIPKSYLSALAYAEELDSKQREFFKNQMAGVAGRTQALVNARVAEIQGILGSQDSLKKIVDGLAGADAKAQANTMRMIDIALAPPKDIAESLQGILGTTKTSSYFADFARINRAEEALLNDFSKAIRDNIKETVENAGSALLASVGHSLAKSQASTFAGLHGYIDGLNSATAASAARSIENMNVRFADIFAGAATSAQMASWFAMPESRHPFSRADRFTEPESTEVRVSKAGVYIEIEPTHQTISMKALKESLAERLWTLVRIGIVTAIQAVEYYRMLDNEPELLQKTLAIHTPKPIRRGKKSQYTEQEQLEIVMGSYTTDLKQWQYAQNYGIDDSVIRRWKKKFKLH